MSGNAIINIEKVKKSYGKTLALKGVSFDVNRDEIFGLTGPNGAGKTTLVKCLVTLIRPDSGVVNIDGNSVYTNHKKIRSLVGFVPSKPVLYPHLSAYENLYLFCNLYGMDKKASKEKIEELLLTFDMWDWRNEKIKNFSTGMTQKINISRGLIHNPKILILDEPTNGLDPQSRQVVRDFILNVRDNGTTVIITSHIMWSVEEICDRIAIINDGKLIALDNITNLKNDHLKEKNILSVKVKGSLNKSKLDLSKKRDKILNYRILRDNAYLFELRGNNSSFLTEIFDEIESISHIEPSLEDVFISLTKH